MAGVADIDIPLTDVTVTGSVNYTSMETAIIYSNKLRTVLEKYVQA